MSNEALSIAVQAALAGDWVKSHNITQDYIGDANNTYIANWIHAVLHKIEGDQRNSSYWYARTNGKKYTDFSNANAELAAILQQLTV